MSAIKKLWPKHRKSHKKQIHVEGTKAKSKPKWRAWLHRYKWYLAGGIGVLVLSLGAMAAQAKAPEDFAYPVKRAAEQVGIALAIGQNAKTDANFNAATNRVKEASVVADRIPQESASQQTKDAQNIQNLLGEFNQTFNDQISSFSHLIDQGIKPPQDKSKWAETGMVNTYMTLEKLRLNAPPEAQASVLQAINTVQSSLATVQDALGKSPVSPTDVTQLTKLVSQGFLTHDELTNLFTKATSNRQLLTTVRGLAESGQVPSSAIYAINYDLVTELAPKDAPRFTASVEFDELRKVAIFAKMIIPTAQQKQMIKDYLTSYKFGQLLPRDASRSYIMPLVYGLNITPNLADDLSKLDPNSLSPVRKILYDAWKPLTAGQTATTDAKQLFGQVLQLTSAVTGNYDLMQRVQLEILNSVRSGMSYLALPPGWTSSQVTATQGDFQQQAKDLKSFATVEAIANTATATLAQITTPLIAPLATQSVDSIRADVAKQMATIQQQLITATSTPTTPQAIVPDLTKELANVQQTFNSKLAALGNTNDATTAQVAALKDALKQSLSSATDAQNKLGQYVIANNALQQTLQQSVASAQAAQTQTLATIQSSLGAVNSAQQGATSQLSSLSSSLDSIQQTTNQNITSLQNQLASAGSATASTQGQLEQALVAQANQIAGLQAKLSLSATTYAALKTDTTNAVNQVTSNQTAAVSAMQKQLNDVSALHSQLNDATNQQVNGIKTAQAQLLSNLNDQINDKQVLKDQMQASINVLQAAQDKADSKMQNLAVGSVSLTQQLKDVQAILDQAGQQIKSNIADTKTARSELQQSIDAIHSAQITAQTQMNDGIAALSTQVRQAIGELNAGQSQIKLDLAALGGSVGQVKNAITDIQNVQLGTQIQLNAQAQATVDLRNQLAQPIAVLQKAQSDTKTQVDGLSADVNQLKTSVSAINQTQVTAQAQISHLIDASVNWSSIPSTLQFNQDQFRQYEQQLSDEFVAKAAAIQQQFNAYKQQLDGNIQQLKGDVNAQLQQLKDTQTQLETQLKQTQDQLKQVQSVPAASTPSATPAATTAPVTTITAPVTNSVPTTTPATTPSTTVTTPGL
jgi:hypothetical protein